MPVHLFLCLCAIQDSTEVTALLKSSPRLVIGPAALQCHIVADRVIVDYNAQDIFGAVMIVLACYFAWDLAYPRCYQILSFLSAWPCPKSLVNQRMSGRAPTLSRWRRCCRLCKSLYYVHCKLVGPNCVGTTGSLCLKILHFYTL